MNITLSADERLIEKAREYAKRHQTSLNNLVREYLQKLTSDFDSDSSAEEFLKISAEFAGESRPDYRFNRTEIYQRPGPKKDKR